MIVREDTSTNEPSSYISIINNVIASGFDGSYEHTSIGLADGVQFVHGVNNSSIVSNHIANWGHCCVEIDATETDDPGVYDNIVRGNVFSGENVFYCRAIEIGGLDGKCYNNVITRNIMRNFTVRNQINGDHNKVTYNLIVNMTNSPCKTSGVAQGIDLEAYSPYVCHDNTIANNIIINCEEAGIRLRTGANNKENNIIANNIIYNCGTNSKDGLDGYGIVVDNASDILNNTFQNNLVYNPGITNVIYYRGTAMTVSTWNDSDSNGDTIEENIQSDPFLTSTYHLSAGSPCIDAGIKVTGVHFGDYWKDLDGNSEPWGSAPDIGCYEYNTGEIGWTPAYTVGSSGCEYTSIQAVFDNEDLEPGDIVEIRADAVGGKKTYVELITIGSDDGGSSSGYVTIKGRDGDTINIINGTIYSGSWSDLGDGRYSCTVSTEVGIVLEDRTILAEASDSTLSDGNWYSTTSTMYYKPTSGVPSDHEIIFSYEVVRSTPGMLDVNGAQYLELKNLNFKLSDGGIGDYSAGEIAHIRITNCTFYQCKRATYFKTDGGDIHDMSFVGNTINYCAKGIGCSVNSSHNSYNCMFKNNEINMLGCITETIPWSQRCQDAIDNEGIYLYRPYDVDVVNNSFFGKESTAQDNAKGVAINVAGSPPHVCNEVYVLRNKFYYLESAGIAVVDGTTDIFSGQIAYNICVGCGFNGQRASISINNTVADDVVISNNIFAGSRYGAYIRSGTDNFKFYNNIFLNNSVVYIRVYDDSIGNNVFDYNCYFGGPASPFRIADTYYTFSDWKSTTGQDSHSFESDPLLSSTYHLSHNSPCINAGTTISGFHETALDIDGQPILGTPDIGCDERKALWWNGRRWHMQRMY
ncbi:MAG TPA: hypothetical protein ENG51_07645 [Deltaproteobacteria bacterium]|nr:hypothetical protein [Deltaproteobacteria bacterium]